MYIWEDKIVPPKLGDRIIGAVQGFVVGVVGLGMFFALYNVLFWFFQVALAIFKVI